MKSSKISEPKLDSPMRALNADDIRKSCIAAPSNPVIAAIKSRDKHGRQSACDTEQATSKIVAANDTVTERQ